MPITPPTRDDVRIFPAREDFRAWLDENHATAEALFIGYYKKRVPKVAMTYVQAVEEALCYGWIDGITYRIDDELTATRFTPRRRTSSWSAVNVARVAELMAAGRMQPAGIRAYEERDRRRDAAYSYEQVPAGLPEDMHARLRADASAREAWDAERPSFRRQATFWVNSAKRPETRERRFDQLLEALRAGSRPRPFLVTRASGQVADGPGPPRAGIKPTPEGGPNR
jgi:uncharacterized protein YdeI (YjbR/CyaY-like superfamily)